MRWRPCGGSTQFWPHCAPGVSGHSRPLREFGRARRRRSAADCGKRRRACGFCRDLGLFCSAYRLSLPRLAFAAGGPSCIASRAGGREGLHGRQLSRRGQRRECRHGQGEGAGRRPAGGVPLAAEAADPGDGLSARQEPGLRQGGRPDRGRQGAQRAQLAHRLHRQLRLLLPVQGRARPAAARRHPLRRRSGARPHRHTAVALCRRRSRRARKPPGPASGRGSISTTRSPPSSCSRCAARSAPRRSTRWPTAMAAPCVRWRRSTTREFVLVALAEPDQTGRAPCRDAGRARRRRRHHA